MGFLSRLFRSGSPGLVHLPSGSFTLDKDGRIMTSTLPQSFPVEHLKAIGAQVLISFRSAKKAQMPMSELIITYSALKLLARELRGGAIIFLMPQSHQRLNPPLKKASQP
jgi:hypothetical protein